MRLMKIAPALLPDLRSTLPTFAVARKQNFERLSEAGLSGSIPTYDEGQTRPGLECDSLAAADSSEAFDLQRCQISAWMSRRRRGAAVMLGDCGIAQVPLEAVAPITGCEDGVGPISLPDALGL